jgi:hypothetical protein
MSAHALHEFVEAWDALEYEGEVRWFSKLRKEMSLGGRAHSPADLAGRLTANRRGFNCYVQLNPSIGARTKRPKAEHVTHYRGFLVDIDPDPTGASGTPHATLHLAVGQLEQALAMPLTPWIIDSGRGAQAWVLGPVEALADGDHAKLRASVSKLVKDLELPTGYHADPSVCDVSRVARLPGTANVRTGRTARVRHRGTAIPGLRQRLLDLAPEVDETEYTIATSADNYRQVFQHLTATAQDFIECGWTYPGRHSKLWHTADLLRRHGLSRAAVARALVLGARQCRPKLTREDVVYALNRTFGSKKLA